AHRFAGDAGDVIGALGALLANANLARLAGNTGSTDINIVTASGEITACAVSQGDVGGAAGIVGKSERAFRRIRVTGLIIIQRRRTISRVGVSAGVRLKGGRTGGGVVESGPPVLA